MNHRLSPFAAPLGRTEDTAVPRVDPDFCCAACARAAGLPAACVGTLPESFDPPMDFDRAAVSRLAEAAWRRSAG